MIDDYVIKGHVLFSFPGLIHLDYEKILKLTDSKFAELYLELMTEYKEKNGWWGKGGVPRCSECNQVIPGPEYLRRYYGRSLHPDCFKKVYIRDGHDTGLIKQYWNRIFKLPDNIGDGLEKKL
jgi:hypothetical protein